MTSTTQPRAEGPIRTTFWLVAARVVLAAAAAVTGLIAAAELGPAARGEVAIGLLIGYTAAVIGIRGLENSLSTVAAGRSFAGALDLALRFGRRSVFPALALTAVAVLVGLVTDRFVWQAPLAVLTIAISTALVRLTAAAGAAAADSRRQTTIGMVSGAVLVAGALGLLAIADTGPTAWLWLYGISTVAGLVAARLPTERLPDIDARLVELTEAERAGMFATLSNFLALRADRMLLPLLASTTALGVYVVASTMVEVLTLPGKAASQVLVARWRLGTTPSVTLVAAVSLVGGLVAAGAMVLVGQLAIDRALGDRYEESAELLWILGPAVALYLAARGVHSVHLSRGDHGAVGTSETIGVIAAVLAYLVLIPGSGATGAAVGSLIGYGLTFMVSLGFGLSPARRARALTRQGIGS